MRRLIAAGLVAVAVACSGCGGGTESSSGVEAQERRLTAQCTDLVLAGVDPWRAGPCVKLEAVEHVSAAK